MNISKQDEPKPENETNAVSNNLSKWFSLILLGIIWLFTYWLISFCFDWITKYYADKNTKLILTPFIFMCVTFISSLVATDSILKTIKYNYRAKESVVGNLIQAVLVAGLAAFAWWNNK